jgi:hypothetical protein
VTNDNFNGACHIGDLSYATLTPVDENGVPIGDPFTYKETVIPSTAEQNPNVENSQNGTVPDRIGAAVVAPCDLTQNQIDNYKGRIAVTPMSDSATQVLTIMTPGRGVVLTLVTDRTTRNVGSVGVDARGIPIPNYTVTVTVRSLTQSVVGRP